MFFTNQFLRAYPNDLACRLKVLHFVYGDSDRCPRCNERTVFYLFHDVRNNARYHHVDFRCSKNACYVNPAALIPFTRNAQTPLHKRFYAVWILGQQEGTNHARLARQLEISYPTALRITRAYQNDKVRLSRLVFDAVRDSKIIVKTPTRIHRMREAYQEAVHAS